MSGFDRRLRVVSQSYVWQLEEDGWRRHLVRKLSNGTAYWSPLVHVDGDRPVCLVCLGQEIMLYHSGRYAHGELFCQECGVRYGLL